MTDVYSYDESITSEDNHGPYFFRYDLVWYLVTDYTNDLSVNKLLPLVEAQLLFIGTVRTLIVLTTIELTHVIVSKEKNQILINLFQ